MADFALLREDLSAFAEEIGCPLTVWQARAVSSRKRIVVIVAPRQSGKSRTLAVFALWSAFREAGARVLIVSASEDAARRLLAEVRRIAAGSELLAVSVREEFAAVLKLSNGSEVRSTPASEKQIRGWTADVLLLDEAALVGDDLLLGAALPTTAARPEAKIVLASSATVASGAFYDFAIQGESGSDHIETVRWGLADAAWLTPSVIQAMRESMSEVRFAAEMEGVFASGQDSLFTRAGLERVTRDFPTWTLETLRGPGQPLGGVDWGASVDHSAVTVLGRVPGEAKLRVLVAHRWPSGEPLHNVITTIADSPAHWHLLTLERNGLGEPCAQAVSRQIRERHQADHPSPKYVVGPWPTSKNTSPRYEAAGRPVSRLWRPRLNGIHTSAAMKAASYSALRLLVDREEIELPASATELLRELVLLRVDLSATGDERIAAAGAGHDDLADSIMLALGPYKRRDGRWITVADVAVRMPVPHPQLDASDDPFAFQSVRGPEVTTRNKSNKPQPVELGSSGLYVIPGGIR